MSSHRRDDELETYEHMREDDAPRWLKWFVYAVNKVGIPGATTFCLLYMMFVTLNRLTLAMNDQASSLKALIVLQSGYHSDAKDWRKDTTDKVDRILSRIKP